MKFLVLVTATLLYASTPRANGFTTPRFPVEMTQFTRRTSRACPLLATANAGGGGDGDAPQPSTPTSLGAAAQRWAVRGALHTLAAATVATLPFSSRAATVAETDADDTVYSDPVNRFSLVIPPSWQTGYARKGSSSTNGARFLSEEVVYSALSIAEGASLSVTKTVAPRLLKDFDVEWWFAPLESMRDVGPADLVAKLLVLQRQGEFERRETQSKVVDAKIDSNGILTFDFTTPLAEGVYRRTQAKAYYTKNTISTIWVSALASVYDGDYGATLVKVRDSFTVTPPP